MTHSIQAGTNWISVHIFVCKTNLLLNFYRVAVMLIFKLIFDMVIHMYTVLWNSGFLQVWGLEIYENIAGTVVTCCEASILAIMS